MAEKQEFEPLKGLHPYWFSRSLLSIALLSLLNHELPNMLLSEEGRAVQNVVVLLKLSVLAYEIVSVDLMIILDNNLLNKIGTLQVQNPREFTLLKAVATAGSPVNSVSVKKHSPQYNVQRT
ncbi:MAG: hypothetical protein OQK35_06760 [Alphaproteobacteria bacterium]|nr:hypothetical protein [Alphaproteobacteria bacterium]